jgi:hypothetical protein
LNIRDLKKGGTDAAAVLDPESPNEMFGPVSWRREFPGREIPLTGCEKIEG